MIDLREQFLGRRGSADEVARVFDPCRQVGVSCEALAKQGDLTYDTRSYLERIGRA